CDATVTSSATSFGAGGGTAAITVGVARDCSWSATAASSWIVFTTATGGQGDGTVGYRVQANGDPSPRQSAITVGDRQVAAWREAAACQFAAAPATSSVAPAGGNVTVTIRTNPACGWTAASQMSWAAVAPASGRGDGSVNVAVSANRGPDRDGAVTVGG